jgi:hypothetical protein
MVYYRISQNQGNWGSSFTASAFYMASEKVGEDFWITRRKVQYLLGMR